MKINLKKLLTDKVLIFFALLILLVMGFFGFWHYRNNLYSADILTLNISGPQNAVVGDEVTYTVTYKNTSSFLLESPKIIFQLPDNSLTEDSQLRLTQNLPNINPGQQGVITFKARLLGKEGDVKTVRAVLDYVPHNLSVRYEADASFDTMISPVPIDIAFNIPAQIQRTAPFNVVVNYTSHVNYPLENASIKIDPIAGLKVTAALPASLDNVEWKLPTLLKEQGGQLEITETADTTAADTVTVSAHFGMWVNGTFLIIKEASQDISVAAAPPVPATTTNTPQ